MFAHIGERHLLTRSDEAPAVRVDRQATPTGRISTALAIQGWTCDRTEGAMAGSGFLAEHAAAAFGLVLSKVGLPGPAADLGWQEALARAAPTLEAARDAVREELAQSRRTLAFLNRCGSSLATIPPLLAAVPNAVLIWVDAHGDYNTPATTTTGYLGGMVVSALCGLWHSGYGAGLAPERLILVGTRDLDPAEGAALRADGVAVVTGQGTTLDVERIVRFVAGRPAVLHIDLDVVDPGFLSTEYVVARGLHPDALRGLVSALAATDAVIGLEVSEFDMADSRDAARVEAALVMHMIEPLLAA